MKALLLYSKIFYQRPTAQSLKSLLARANKWQLLNFTCALSAIMHNAGMVAMTPQWQIEFLNELKSSSAVQPAAEQMRKSGELLLSELQLGLLARYVLHYCSEDETIGDLSDIVLRALLMTNELFTEVPSAAKSASERSAFFSIETQSAVIPNERLAHVVQRFYRLFRWADSISDDTEDWLPLRSDFQRLMDMSADEYLTAAFCLFSHFLAMKSAHELPSRPPYFTLSTFGAGLKKRNALNAWIHNYSVAADQLKTLNFEPTFTVADLAPFIETPLVKLGDELYFCPVLSLLEDTLNTRLYFTLFNAYKTIDGLEVARRFSRFQGHFLEDYVADLVKMMLPPDYDLSREVRYFAPGGHRKSTDVLARRSDGASVFIEVTKTRFRLTESLFALDEQAVMKDLDSMVLRKAAQIQRSINDLKSGLWNLAGSVGMIAPVVVTGQGIPGLVYLKHRIEAELTARQLLQSTVPLLYCDIEEVEGLALADPGHIDLFALLCEKADHSDGLARVQGLKNYLHYFREDLSRKKTPRETTFPEYEEAVEKVVMPTVRLWGLRDGPFGAPQ